MICPHCFKNMHHLNIGGGFSRDTQYQTYDYLECPECHETAIEFYHTEFVKTENVGKIPVFSI